MAVTVLHSKAGAASSAEGLLRKSAPSYCSSASLLRSGSGSSPPPSSSPRLPPHAQGSVLSPYVYASSSQLSSATQRLSVTQTSEQQRQDDRQTSERGSHEVGSLDSQQQLINYRRSLAGTSVVSSRSTLPRTEAGASNYTNTTSRLLCHSTKPFGRRTCDSEPCALCMTSTDTGKTCCQDFSRTVSTAPRTHNTSIVKKCCKKLPSLAPAGAAQRQPPPTSSSQSRRRPNSSAAEVGLRSPPLLDAVALTPKRSSSYSSASEQRSRTGRLWTANDPTLLNSGVRKRAAVRQVGVVMPFPEESDPAQPSSADEVRGSTGRDSSESRMEARMHSLPAVVCKSANGDVILMETRNIQNLRIQREFGKEGQRLARSRMRSQLSTPRALAADAWREGHMDVGRFTHRAAADDIQAIGERAGLGPELEGMSTEEAEKVMMEAQKKVDAYYKSVTEGYHNRRGGGDARGGGEMKRGVLDDEGARLAELKAARVVHGGSWRSARNGGIGSSVEPCEKVEYEVKRDEAGGSSSGTGAAPKTDDAGPARPPVSAAHKPMKIECRVDSRVGSGVADELACIRDIRGRAQKMAARTERWEEASSHSRPQMMARKRVNGKSSANGVGATKDGSKRSGMWAKLQKGAQAKAAGSVIDALQKRDALSLKAGAEERRRRREEIAAEWGREQTRELSLLVPPPPELPDEEIPTRSAQLKSRSRGPTANGEIDPGTKQELEQFEQLEAAVAEHEDFHWSGGFGTLSKRRHDGRVVWKAVCDANEVAFDEEQATELEEQARKTSEVARTLGSRMDEDPVNRGLKAKFMRSVEELHAQRPYFQTADPSALKVRHRRMPWQRATGDADDRPRSPPAWRLEDSIFSQRAKESDAKSFLTPPKLARMQVEMDWSRVIAKSRFQKLLRKAMGHSGIEEGNNEAFKQDLAELEDMVLLRYPTIRSAFYYYCARGTGIGEVSFSLLPNQWTTFCRETGITDPVSAYCSQGNLQSLFIATNFEEGGAMSREEDVENDDNALMRFEWVEILIRVAIEKYIKDKQATNDVREAFVMLCDENLSQLPRDAVLDCNEFRQQRLYTPAVDSVLREHHSLLKALFKMYKAKDSAKWFGMEHWVAFLESVSLVGNRSTIGLTHAKLLFMWSQMDVVDELRRRQRVVGWSFTDFLEGIARLADVMQLPTPAELEDMRKTSGFKLPGKLAYWEYLGPVSRPRTRPTTATGDGERKNGDIVLSANEGPGSFSSTTAAPPLASSALGDGASPSRPLEEKLDALLNLLVAGLSEVWNVEGVDSARLAERLTTMATFLSGGIEIGH